jgi:outer membrane protein assembly factor BamB
MGRMRRTLALAVLPVMLAACGGTITLGSSTPNAQGRPSGVADIPTPPPLTPPPGTTPGTLLAFDAGTGNPLWQSQALASDLGQPVVSGGMVFAPGGYGGPPIMLAAINAKNGDLIWRTAGYAVCGGESFGLSILLVTTCGPGPGPRGMSNVIRALDPKTGRELWTSEGVGAAVSSGPVLLTVMNASGDFKVRGLDPSRGEQLWESPLTATNIPPFVNGQVALVWQNGCLTGTNPPEVTPRCPGPGQFRSFLSRIDIASGAELWQAGFGQGGQLRRLLLGDVAVATVDVELPPAPGQPPSEAPPPGFIDALDLGTGGELWRQSVTGDSSVPDLAAPGTVYIEQIRYGGNPRVCPTSRLDALDSKTGALRWRVDGLSTCETTVDADAHTAVLVLRTFSGTRIMVVDAASGAELWEKSMVTSSPYPLVHATVSGGVVYVTESGQFPLPSPASGD